MSSQKYRDYLASEHWAAMRKWALERADHRCQVCNESSRLHVHHRTYERLGHEWPSDLTVLCEGCHAIFHDKLPGMESVKPGMIPWPERIILLLMTEHGKFIEKARGGTLSPEMFSFEPAGLLFGALVNDEELVDPAPVGLLSMLLKNTERLAHMDRLFDDASFRISTTYLQKHPEAA